MGRDADRLCDTIGDMDVEPGRFAALLAARHALDALQDYIAEAIHDPWPGQRTMPEPHAQVRDSALHLWYGPADDVVLACEPILLADLMDG
jgi:hypothetical protein